jgi:hypothetical protein
MRARRSDDFWPRAQRCDTFRVPRGQQSEFYEPRVGKANPVPSGQVNDVGPGQSGEKGGGGS